MYRTTHCLLIMDSRGRHMDNVLRYYVGLSRQNIQIKLIFVPGANIVSLTEAAIQELRTYQYDMVLLMGGVNDLTRKQRGGTVQPIFHEVDRLVDTLYDRFEWSRWQLARWCGKVAIGRLVGLDINRYNERYQRRSGGRGIVTDHSHAQGVIDEAMIYLNKAIASLNTDSNVLAPWTLDTVHYQIRHRYVHKYFKLKDGLHLTNTLRARWAYKIVKAVCQNFWLPLPVAYGYRG